MGWIVKDCSMRHRVKLWQSCPAREVKEQGLSAGGPTVWWEGKARRLEDIPLQEDLREAKEGSKEVWG